MAYRCPDAKLVGKSEINGYELLFKGSQTGSYATIEPYKDSTVPVLVWKISANDEKNLDMYEGFPTFYYKKNLKVTVNGKTIRAMVYIMDEKRPIGIPTRHYYNILARAYQKFGFNCEILQDAYIVSKYARMPVRKTEKAVTEND